MKKIETKTLIFLIVTIFSMILIFIFSSMLINNNPSTDNIDSIQPINQTKVKAENKTYTKTLSLNNPNIQNTSTPNTPTPNNATPTPSIPQLTSTPTPSPQVTRAATPTPTEIILAYNNSTEESEIIETATPTATVSLPESGNILPLFIIFTISFFIILFALIY